MSPHFFLSEWACSLCHFDIDKGEQVVLVASKPSTLVYTSRQRKHSCPSHSCADCRAAPRGFPYHLHCHQLYETIQHGKSQASRASIDALCQLGQALLPILPVAQPSSPDIALQLLKRSFHRHTLAKLSTCHAIKTEHNLIHLLSSLPTEILSEFIAPRIIPSQLQYALPILGETDHLLQRLRQWPALDFSLCCQGAVFATQTQFGKRYYITNLSAEESKDSFLVKSRHASCNFVLVWLDHLGITHIEFQESIRIESPRRNSEWVYAVELTEKKIYVKSKGVFLERVTSSSESLGQIIWDCSYLPLGFHPNNLPNVRSADPYSDVVLHYVPMDSVTGISVASCPSGLLAIVSHTAAHHPTYEETYMDAVWTYCPLTNDKVKEVWWTHCDTLRSALIIRTEQKEVWLGCSLPQRRDLECTQIASSSLSALYYTDFDTSPHTYVVGAVPALDEQSLAVPALPIYQTVPYYGLRVSDLSYSEAPLSGVVRAQLCMDGGFCIGLVLQYESCSRSVGQFRYDKDISEWFQQPSTIGIVLKEEGERRKFTLQANIRFDAPGPTGIGSSEGDQTESVYSMTGVLVWWYKDKVTDIRIRPS
ncbi:hypothetical protein K505DRAFT_368832 [Melanomma pulvis-pyrius CBS 109.77]|uniref:Uncharacterized protein n=1 Tax=Melanomma pulvis-pyrius CBS 109.77 TaxID=1314802 RepID=A0A6A6WNU4_9PLEO|nr:hypothetical protein K505DRAFT_368832 [Melanomma pulvis-pyrius CBS 109.77]